MFQRTRRGLAIAGSSFRVLAQHPRLVVLPVTAAMAHVSMLVLVGGSMFATERAHLGWPVFAAEAFLLLFAGSFVSYFFNAALVACVLDAFNGRAVSLGAGLASASARAGKILGWAIFTSTVGVLLRVLQDQLRRFGILGLLLGTATGLTWSIATFFVVPVLVAENVGPWEAVKRSMEIAKRLWSNAIGVEVGLGLFMLLALVPPILLIAIINGAGAQMAEHDLALLFAGAASGLYFIVLVAIVTTLNSIFRTGIYVYAVSGATPEMLDHAVIEGALRR
jgi:hypothetical protein